MFFPFSIENPPIWATPYFYNKILIPHSITLKNVQPPLSKGGSHYEYYIWSTETVQILRWMQGTFEFDQSYKQTESKMRVTGNISSNK